MIYEVYLNEQLLYYPNDEDFAIIDAKLETSLNEAGSFECDVPKNNKCYDSLNSMLRSGMIKVLKDGAEVFYGEVREVEQSFDFTKHLYAVGELAFLFDSIQPQKKYQTSPANFFKQMIASHNSQVEAKKKFTAGSVLVTDDNDYVYHYTNYEDTLTAIREKLCKTMDGYLRIRKVGNTRYLDLVPLENYGHYCTQEIQFGENMLDYSCNYSASDIATAVIPLGARLEEEERTSAAVDGLDEYLTIKSVNNNSDYLVNQTAAARYGYVKVVKHWDDVTVPATLKSKAQKWLTSAQYSTMELELNAIDLNLLDQNIDSFEVGDTIHAWAEPFGMDTTFPVRKKTIYLNDLSKNYIVLSNTEISQSYTSIASGAVDALREEIPEISPFLVEAKTRALNMLLDETQGGHVVYEYAENAQHEPLYIEAINICDSPTIEASTKRWRWSQNGLGFMSRKNITSAWSSLAVAMTSNGEIVADMIKTGTLDASRIKASVISAINDGTGKINEGKLTITSPTIFKLINGNDDDTTVINGGKIKTKSISANRLNVASLSAISANMGTVTSGKFTTNEKRSAYDGKEVGMTMDVNGIGAGNGKACVFRVDAVTGKLVATNAEITGKITSSNADITGKITSNNGKIGEWTIQQTGLSKYGNSNQWVSLGSTLNNYEAALGYWKREGGAWNKKFGVDWDGNMYASNAEIKGKIEATSGYFGTNASTGWNVGSNYINSKNGPTSILDDTTAGTYVGTDGIVNNYGGKSAMIMSGEIRTTGLLMGGNIATSGDVSADTVRSHYFETLSGGEYKDGATGQVTIIVDGHTYVIQATHGLITYIGSN